MLVLGGDARKTGIMPTQPCGEAFISSFMTVSSCATILAGCDPKLTSCLLGDQVNGAHSSTEPAAKRARTQGGANTLEDGQVKTL